MPTTGLTSAGANAIINAWRGVTPLALSATALTLHTNFPGPNGTSNVFEGVTQQRALFTWGSPVAGAASLSGAQPFWAVTGAGTLNYISGWDDLADDAGVCHWTAPLRKSRTVANGDTVYVSSLDVAWENLAAA